MHIPRAAYFLVCATVAYAKTVSYDFTVGYVTVSNSLVPPRISEIASSSPSLAYTALRILIAYRPLLMASPDKS